jgi:dihydroorotate dehydrogenase electron transfer subunit
MIGTAGRTVPLSRLPDDGPFAPSVPPPLLLDAPVADHRQVADEYWRLVLEAPEVARRTQPGQFVMLTVAAPDEPAPVLPRPMAIFGSQPEAGTIDIVYRVVGEGTNRLARSRPGDRITTVGPLGRGFVLHEGVRRILLLGRGIGTCSLTALATEACRRGVTVAAIASARHPGALIGPEDYRAVGVADVVAVIDSDGTSALPALAARLEELCSEGVDEFFVCGSSRLLAAAADLADRHGAGVQVSLEAHMACGLGFCHGCATGRPGLPHETPLVCADGPVFRYPAANGAAVR